MAGTPTGTPNTTRRERLREATLREIRDHARQQLVAEGAAAISLRAIAREMGMTAPALYRYYPSHEELVTALTADLYNDLADHLEAARDAVDESVEGPGPRLLAACRALRTWSLEHPAEFGLVFATPVPNLAAHDEHSPAHVAGMRFGGVFYDLMLQLWQRAPFPVVDQDELDPNLLRQLAAYSEMLGGQMPANTVHVFLACWIRLYGLVCMEVFDQLHFCLDDVEPMFEECLRELATMLGVEDAYRHSG